MTYYPNHDNLYPAEDDGYSVGSPSARWKDGYFGPDSLHLATTIAETGTARDWAFTVDGSGNLVLRESSVRKLFLDTDGKLALNAGAANEQLTIDGKISLVEGSAPTATSGYGKVYAKSSDSKLYFLSAGGTEYDLTASGTPASGDGYVQFNNAGVFGSDVTFYWNNTSKQLSIGSNSPNERLTVSGAVSLAEGSAPSATSGFGKIYIKSSDSKLYFKDDSGTEFDLTAGGASGAAGLVQLSDGASNFTSDSGFKYSADHLSVLGSTKLTKPVSVGETINVYGNSISLSADTNQGAVARAVGIVATYNQTVFNQAISSFTAGVAGVSQPIIGVGSSVSGQWAAGDIIQVSGSPQNDGLYEIEGIGGGLNVTIKGVGTVDTTENFTRRQFVTTTGESASAFKVIVSSLRSGTDGNWEQGKGSAAPLTYADLSTGSVAAAGSSGAVQFNASGTLAADDTNFFWDDTNNFLGLGVNTPGARLHVAGSSIIDASALSAQSGMDLYSNPGIDGDNNVVLSLLASTSMAANVGGGIAFGGRYTSGGAFAGWAGIKGIKEDATSGNLAASLVFTTRANAANVTEQMRLNSAGYLSIGTTSAIERLAVSGAIAIAEATAPSATSGYGKVYVKSSDSKLYFKDDGGTEFDLTAGASVAGSSGAVQFNSSGSLGADTSNFFWDDTNNRLGIRTSSPSHMLHMVGGVLPANEKALFISASLDNNEECYRIQAVSTGSSGSKRVGLVHLQAGYTGSDDAVTTVTICEAVSAGVSFDPVTGAQTTGGAFAVRNEAYGSSSSGYNFGAFNWAANGLLSVGSRNTIGHSGFANNGFVQDSLNIGSINAISLSKHASSTTERHYGSTSSAAGGDFNIGAISGLGLTKTGIEAYSFSAAHVFDNGAVSAPIWVALDNGSEVARLADGGNLGLGVSSPNERLTISGVLSIAEGTAPSATSGYGKIYVKSADSKLYFQNDSGTEYDLTAGGGGGTPAGSSGAIQFNSAGSFGADGYLFWDDTNNYLGVGTSTPNSTMDVRGSVSKAFSVKTANYTLTDLDYSLFVNANSGSITISLPAASTCAGRVYIVKKIDSSSNNVVLDADGSELIDSISSFTLIVQNQSVTVQSDGSGWWII
jgi:hypothetical protein